MRRQTWSGILAAGVFAATVAVGAQAPSTSQAPPAPVPQPPTATQPPAPAPPQSSEGRRITVAGCLQAAPSSPTGTSGSAASAPAATDAAAKAEAASGDSKFVLANAVAASADAAATASNSSAPRTYRLIANDAALTPHVGKKVELSGTVDDQDRSANSSSAANAPKLRVEAGKVVAEACTP